MRIPYFQDEIDIVIYILFKKCSNKAVPERILIFNKLHLIIMRIEELGLTLVLYH